MEDRARSPPVHR